MYVYRPSHCERLPGNVDDANLRERRDLRELHHRRRAVDLGGTSGCRGSGGGIATRRERQGNRGDTGDDATSAEGGGACGAKHGMSSWIGSLR